MRSASSTRGETNVNLTRARTLHRTSSGDMEWQTDVVRRERKAVDNPSNVPLDVHIRAARDALEAERERLPALRKELAALVARRDVCVARHQHRMRLDLAADAAELEERIRRIEEGVDIREYESSMRPFLDAYMKKISPDDAEGPAGKKVRCGKGGVELSSFVATNNAKQSAIVAEYLTEVCREPPRMHIVKQDLCPSCSEDMMLIPAKSIMTCPKCGLSSSYLDATTSSISYGDEVEFASFSYKASSARPVLFSACLAVALTRASPRPLSHRTAHQPLQRVVAASTGKGKHGNRPGRHRQGDGGASSPARHRPKADHA